MLNMLVFQRSVYCIIKNIIRSHVHAQNVSTDQLIQLGQQLIQLDVLLLAMYM
jgi:hypothetical protein